MPTHELLKEYVPCENCPDPEAARLIIADKVARLFNRIITRSAQPIEAWQDRTSIKRALESRLVRNRLIACVAAEANNCQLVNGSLGIDSDNDAPTEAAAFSIDDC